MPRIKKIVLYLTAVSYIAVGVYHFVNPRFLHGHHAAYLPLHLELVYLSGVFEILLGGLLCVPKTQQMAGWGLILLLIAVFPANIHLMSTEAQAALGTSQTVAIVRLPFQALFIGIAYWLTKNP